VALLDTDAGAHEVLVRCCVLLWVAAKVERFVSRRLCQNRCGLVADAAVFLLLAALLLHLVRHKGAE